MVSLHLREKQLEGAMAGEYLYYLPESLLSLAFSREFNHSLASVTLPNSLQSLTFGLDFNQSLDRVSLPSPAAFDPRWLLQPES